MRNQKTFVSGIHPDTLYPVPFLANLIGIHPSSVYLSLAGQRDIPLPTVTRLGAGIKPMIRFRGQHILDWLNHLSPVEVLPVPEPELGEDSVPEPAKAMRGRPRKVMLGEVSVPHGRGAK